MALITSTITYYRSTYFPIEVNVTPPDGLTAAEALFTVKSDRYDSSPTDATAIIKKDVMLTDNAGTIEIENGDVADTVEPGTYYYSIYIRMSNNDVYPFANGKFKMIATPTNRET
jgi:hypothetical protein